VTAASVNRAPIELRQINPNEIVAGRQALAHAFDADPLFQYFFPREKRRARWLEIIMAGTLAETVPDANVFVPANGGATSGVMALLPPGAYPPPSRRRWGLVFRRSRRPGFGLPPWRLWRSALPTLSAIGKLHYPEPHYYLQTVGVDPEFAGKGIGGAFMRHLCQLSDAAGVPAYLETSNPVNLGFYRRFGFAEREQIDAPGGGPPIWTMLRV